MTKPVFPVRLSVMALLGFVVTSTVWPNSSPAQTPTPSVTAAPLPPSVSELFYRVYPVGSDQPFHSVVFDDLNLAQSSLRVTGEGDTYYVYKSFRDQDSDYLIESRVNCAPNCSQDISLYKFNGTKFTKSPFRTAYPFDEVASHLKKFRTKLPLLEASSQYLDWILINKKTEDIEFLLMDQNFNDVTGRLKVYRAGILKLAPHAPTAESEPPKSKKSKMHVKKAETLFEFKSSDSVKQTNLRPVDIH